MNNLRFFIAGVLLLSLTSCITPRELTEDDELTPKEYQQLLKKIRSFIKVSPKLNLNPLSEADKNFTYTTEPKFKAYYTGHKSGSFRMIWAKKRPQVGFNSSRDFNDFTECNITIRGKGKFLEDTCKIRMTVSKFAH